MSKITESARGEQCLARIRGVKQHDPATVVAAHVNGGGMGTKHPDSEVCYACINCHDIYDRRLRPPDGVSYQEVELDFFHGCVRTRKKLIEKGLLICL